MSAITFDSAVMRRMVEHAVDFSTQKVGHKSREQTLEALQQGDCTVCEYLRYGLAQEVAKYLGSVDHTVKAVYVYEPEYATAGDGSVPDRSNLSPGISMIIWASRKNAALSSVVNLMSSALTEEIKRLACPKANALCHMLDAHVVDDDEVLGRTGYGALIDSFYVRPMEIWHR